MNKLKDIKKVLYSALKKDLGIEVWNINIDSCKLSIYKLEDCYNDLHTLHFKGDYYYNEGYTVSKEKTKIAKKLLTLIKEHVSTRGENGIKEIEELFKTYKEITDKLYKAKFSMETLNLFQ